MIPVLKILLLGLIFCSCATAEKRRHYFTGQVEYKYSYESITLNIDSLSEIKPGKSVFRYDTANYQSQFISKDTSTYFYSGVLNKAVSKTNSQFNNDCEDYSQPTDSIYSYRVYETDEKLLGYDCRVLAFESKIFQTKYYISKELRIAPATYKKHKAYNWSFYGEKTGGGLILKLEHRFKNYTMSGIATNITEKNENFLALEIGDDIIKSHCLKK